jgi:hypothetical protein
MWSEATLAIVVLLVRESSWKKKIYTTRDSLAPHRLNDGSGGHGDLDVGVIVFINPMHSSLI